MELATLMKEPLPEIPAQIEAALGGGGITAMHFDEKDRILLRKELQQEVGWQRMEDGSYLVAMTCPMPGVTAEMIEWWFWWHAQDSLRYQVWFPGAHIRISYRRKDKDYFAGRTVPSFRPHPQYPVERIGGVMMPLRIDFVTPEDFGFSRQIMEAQGVETIVCGHVSAFGGLIPHTEMAHIYCRTPEGLRLISRFWLGKTMKNPLLRRWVITDAMARGMAEHCCVEYRNLARILPRLYREYAT